MKNAKVTVFEFCVKSFVMNEDGQGRSYRFNYLYSANPKGAWEYIQERLNDEIAKEPKAYKPCKVSILAYDDGFVPIKKEVRVKTWEGVNRLYAKWFEKIAA